MCKYIFLDSTPLGLLSTPEVKRPSKEVLAIRQWAIRLDRAGCELIVPEITDYEIRRELLRANKPSSIAELNGLKSKFLFLPLTSAAMLKAAALWAESRQSGQPTGHAENIDVDVILAAQALTSGLPLDEIVVATTNVRHLTQFVYAELWQNIA